VLNSRTYPAGCFLLFERYRLRIEAKAVFHISHDTADVFTALDFPLIAAVSEVAVLPARNSPYVIADMGVADFPELLQYCMIPEE
jgi:hypothetical protein